MLGSKKKKKKKQEWLAINYIFLRRLDSVDGAEADAPVDEVLVEAIGHPQVVSDVVDSLTLKHLPSHFV